MEADFIQPLQRTKAKACKRYQCRVMDDMFWWWIRVITKLPNSEQSYKGKVKTH